MIFKYKMIIFLFLSIPTTIFIGICIIKEEISISHGRFLDKINKKSKENKII